MHCLKYGDDTIIFLMVLNNFMAQARWRSKRPPEIKEEEEKTVDYYRERVIEQPFNLGGWRGRSTPDQTADEQQILCPDYLHSLIHWLRASH
ncbi:hypothetical protein TNCT_216831 [Trichonephila clavata]|uniref:Uncharacterized protein n=1 Tax=Trichonephila clavata TaxID=2740835 RepID=A0A8X6LTM2_TRICU|nr:hypothetical protein TNCT_216831 [Trichonephila clavata]